MFLLLDIKKIIASFCSDVWYLLWKVDPEFREYANSHTGRLDYVRAFEEYEEIDCCKTWRLFGKFHRLHDLPAIIFANSQDWYVGGKRHRENDMPAIVYANGTRLWYMNGELHRENNLPVIVGSK